MAWPDAYIQSIVIAEKARAAIVAALHDVLRNVWQVDTAAAWHWEKKQMAGGAVLPSAQRR